MSKLSPTRVGLFSLMLVGAALRACCQRSIEFKCDAPTLHAEIRPGQSARRYRISGPIIALLSVAVIVFAVYWAFQLTQQAAIPEAAGSARLLVTGNPFSPSDRFQLGLVTDDPQSLYIEYHIVAGCNSKSKESILMLSGNARLLHPRVVGSSHVTERTTYVGQPWFPSPQAVQVFDIPVQSQRCPAGVSPSQFGTATALGGFVSQPMEDAAGSSYALQLPLVGDEEVIDTHIPTLGGYWSPPLDLSVYVYAGGLPLYDRIDVTRPALTGSGDLSWSGQSFIRPSATWTDLSSASRGQFLVLLIGALIGIFGSALVAVVIEWIRGPNQQNEGGI
jgi:hypothetical protein